LALPLLFASDLQLVLHCAL